MNPGKISENILKRSVFKNIDNKSASVGADCAFFDVKNGQTDLQADYGVMPEIAIATGFVANESFYLFNTDKGTHGPAGHAIIRGVNNLAAAGAKATDVMLTIVMPDSAREIKLKSIMQDANRTAKELGIKIIGGHTETVSGITKPIISAVVTGSRIGNWKPSEARSGQTIVMTKWMGLSGSAHLAGEHREQLELKLPRFLLDDTVYMDSMLSVVPEAAVAVNSNAVCMHDVADGGIFAGLWQLAERDGVGLEVDLKSIPVHQETIEVCEFFDINPYKLRSDGSLLIVTNEPERLIEALAKEEIKGTIIGHITEGRDRVIIAGEERRFLEEPRQDEFYMV